VGFEMAVDVVGLPGREWNRMQALLGAQGPALFCVLPGHCERASRPRPPPSTPMMHWLGSTLNCIDAVSSGSTPSSPPVVALPLPDAPSYIRSLGRPPTHSFIAWRGSLPKARAGAAASRAGSAAKLEMAALQGRSGTMVLA